MDLFTAKHQQHLFFYPVWMHEPGCCCWWACDFSEGSQGASSHASCYRLATSVNLVFAGWWWKSEQSLLLSACFSPCVFSVSVDSYTLTLSMWLFRIVEIPSKGKVKLVIIYYLFIMFLGFYCKSIRNVHLF